MKRAQVESTADAYLELLAARGIDYIFGNGGTDFGPLIDAYAKRSALEQPVPTPMTVPHEITAIAMAHGYTMVTGRPQAVMVHTIAGTANATGGLINANRQQVPMLFSAGRTPLTEEGLKGSRNGLIHWAQESFDQGSMVREWVKWDYELRPGADLEGIVDRALAISQTQPQGPVYLTLPREVLAQEREEIEYSERPRMTAGTAAPAPDAIAAAAKALAAAKNPIIITENAGREPAAVPQLVRLAELLGVPVFSGAGFGYVNFPVAHPLYQTGALWTSSEPFDNVDVILAIESEVPWMPSSGKEPSPDATIIALGQDPLFERYPVRGFRVDINLTGSPRLGLAALMDALQHEMLDEAVIDARRVRWTAEHEKGRAAARARAEAGKDKQPIDKSWFAHCLEQTRDDDTVIVNELGVDLAQFEFDRPGSFYGVSSAGVLGWGLGAGLGVKLAARDKTVVACIGDGSYTFGVPPAAHWVARKFNLPVLFVVWNNSQWSAVVNAARAVYPEGWAAKSNSFAFSDLSPSLDYEMYCQSAGGYGERVEDPAEVPAALERALHAVKVEKRQALLNVIGASR
jgi:acetolactate synthase-1/2/3 large subunit